MTAKKKKTEQFWHSTEEDVRPELRAAVLVINSVNNLIVTEYAQGADGRDLWLSKTWGKVANVKYWMVIPTLPEE
jgi:hypothetical protein